jgi:hypothetical protein
MGRRRWERWSPAGIRGGEGPVERGVGEWGRDRDREEMGRRRGLGNGEWGWGEEDGRDLAKSPTPLSNSAPLGVRHYEA